MGDDVFAQPGVFHAHGVDQIVEIRRITLEVREHDDVVQHRSETAYLRHI
jgi:hypothetical protein